MIFGILGKFGIGIGDQKIFIEKKNRRKKNDDNFWSRNFFDRKKFWLKKSLAENFFDLIFFDQKNSRPKIFRPFFFDQIFFDEKNHRK